MIEIRHNGMRQTKDTQFAYNELYANKSLNHIDSYYLWLISLIKPKKNGLLLDISTGEGRLVQLAYKKGLKAIGMDFSIKSIEIACRFEPSANWVIGDGENLPFSNSSMDYITNIGSLEHFQNPETGIREISRILKPKGIACILLPNTFSLFGNIFYNIKTGSIYDDSQPLQRYNTYLGWYNMLLNNGLQPYKTFGFELVFPRIWKDFIWYIYHPQKFLRKILSIFLPKNLSNCIVYLCHKENN